jgi:multidrug resistance efflux pump
MVACSLEDREEESTRAISSVNKYTRQTRGEGDMTRRQACLLVLLAAAHPACGQEPKKEPLNAPGTLMPARLALVTAVRPGRVDELLVKEGQAVKKGEIIARLDATDARLSVERAQANLELVKAKLGALQGATGKEEVQQAEADVEASKARLRQLEAEVARLERLVVAGAAAKEELLQGTAKAQEARELVRKAEARLAALKEGPPAAQVKVARAEVAVAEAEVKRARASLDATVLRSPIDGVVTRLNVEVGAFTNPAQFGLASAASVAEITDPSAVECHISVSIDMMAKLTPGQPCDVTLAVPWDAVYAGTVDRIATTVDRARGTGSVWVKVDTRGKPLLAPFGTAASVKFK